MLGKVTTLHTRLVSLPPTAVPSTADTAALVALLRGATRWPAVVSAACDLVASLCDRGDVSTDVKTREALGNSGVVPILIPTARAWMDAPDVLWHCVCALAAVCGGKPFDSHCEGNILLAIRGGGIELMESLLAAALGTTISARAVAQWTLVLGWQLGRPDGNEILLIASVGAVMSVMARHGDVHAVVEAGLGYLVNEAATLEHCAPLMEHVSTAMSAMSRHVGEATVAEQGLWFLKNEAVVAENRVPLMAHVDSAVSAMVRHCDRLSRAFHF